LSKGKDYNVAHEYTFYNAYFYHDEHDTSNGCARVSLE
jgi:hypothetical protein